MRKNCVWAAFVIAAALIETTWLEAIRIRGVLPDLVLISVVYFALSDGEERAMFTAVLGGLFQDVASNATLGLNVLCLALVGFAAGKMTTRLVTEHPAVKAGLTCSACLLNGLLRTAIQFLQNPDMNAWHAVVSVVIPSTFYTAVFSPIVFYMLDGLFRRPPSEETETQ